MAQPSSGQMASLQRPSNWEMHKSTIRRIYLIEDKSLQDLRTEMAEKHGFCKTYVPNDPLVSREAVH